MEANELMIGDWVHFPNMNGRVAELKDQFCEFKPLSHATYDLVEPIPITPEILEKNGFVYDCGFWTIANPRYNNVRMVTYYSINDDVADAFLGHWAFDENYAIDYVHELQHALRLCGLNELADNFKV